MSNHVNPITSRASPYSRYVSLVVCIAAPALLLTGTWSAVAQTGLSTTLSTPGRAPTPAAAAPTAPAQPPAPLPLRPSNATSATSATAATVAPAAPTAAVAAVVATALPAAINLAPLPPLSEGLAFTVRTATGHVDARFSSNTGVPASFNLGFDAAQPQAASAAFEIESLGLRSTVPAWDVELRTPHWFDPRRYPRAKFAASGARSLGAGRYEMTGKLSLKGITQDVTFIFSETPTPTGTVIDGEMPFKRAQFRLGDESALAGEDVSFRVRIARNRPTAANN